MKKNPKGMFALAMVSLVAGVAASAQSGAPHKVTVNASDQSAARGT